MKKAASLAHLDVLRFSLSESAFEGSLKLADLPRLQEALFGDNLSETDFVLNYRAALSRDAENRVCCALTVQGTVPMQCQRCLEGFSVSVQSDRLLALVSEDSDLRRLPRRYEPVAGELTRLNLLAAIEDEILLSLPMFPVHADGQCRARGREVLPEKSSETRRLPFADLNKLLSPPKGK